MIEGAREDANDGLPLGQNLIEIKGPLDYLELPPIYLGRFARVENVPDCLSDIKLQHLHIGEKSMTVH